MENTIYLRSLELTDLENIHRWHNNANLFANLIGTHRFVSHSTVEKWLSDKIAYSANTKEINLAVCLKSDDTHIGNVYLQDIDWINRNATIGVFIGDSEQRGKGYGCQAMESLIHYAFKTLGLNRIYSIGLEKNTTSMNLCKKVGFVVEGKMKNHIFQEGRYWDVLVLGLCREDFRS